MSQEERHAKAIKTAQKILDKAIASGDPKKIEHAEGVLESAQRVAARS